MNYDKIEKAADAFYAKVNAENKDTFRSTYENNRKALNSYKFWRHKPLPSFDELPFEICLKNSEGDFVMVDKKSGNSSETYNLKPSKRATKPFFRDLSKPILAKNELNAFHYKYLWDNVRKSEDFGGDNHIYMYYDSDKLFSLLLSVEDITPYLQNEKFIFLFGEDDLAKNYPLDFKKIYGIDYKSMPPQPVRIDEIRRMVSDWMINGYSGKLFFAGILDWHKNLLTTKDYSFSGFAYLYITCLKGRTVPEALAEINKRINEDKLLQGEIFYMLPLRPGNNPVEDANNIFQKLREIFKDDYKPSKIEWFKGFYLAYAVAAGRNLNQRIAPMIIYETHLLYLGYADYPITLEDMYDIYREMPYFYSLSVIRRPTIALGSQIDVYCRDKIEKNFISAVASSIKIPIGYINKDDEFLPARALIRFEDLKLNSKATLESILDFLDIEWDDSLMEVTSNGFKSARNLAGKQVFGYDTTPVYNLHEKVLSVFDTYRIKILNERHLKQFGYKPLYYKDNVKYALNEIKNLFDVRFKCEELYFSDKQRESNEAARKKLLEYVEKRVKFPDENAETGEKLVPIPWLKPKREFIKSELYE